MILGNGSGTLRHSGTETSVSVTGDLILGNNASGAGNYIKTGDGLAIVKASTTGGAGRLIVGRNSVHYNEVIRAPARFVR